MTSIFSSMLQQRSVRDCLQSSCLAIKGLRHDVRVNTEKTTALDFYQLLFLCYPGWAETAVTTKLSAVFLCSVTIDRKKNHFLPGGAL